MNLLDVVILAVVVGAAVAGYRLGFLTRVASWVGLGVGLVVAARALPWVFDRAASLQAQSRLLVAAVTLVGGAFVGQALGLIVGSKLRMFVPGPLRTVDRAVGAAVGVVGVLVLVWALLPAMADVSGWPSRQARNSAIARNVHDAFPTAPDTLRTLRRLVGEQAFPRVFESLTPAPDAGPAPGVVPLSASVQQRVRSSTVKVKGSACARIQEGSGFSVRPNQVVTNAHVVAGDRQVSVLRADGATLRASVVVFDPERDLAVLSVPNLSVPSLGMGVGRVGDEGGVFGHPGGQDPLRVAPASIRQQVQATGRDLYDARSTRRDVFVLAAVLKPGDSGAALVATTGQVVGVAFAVAPDRPGTAYALTAAELQGVLAAPVSGPVSTGPCLTA